MTHYYFFCPMNCEKNPYLSCLDRFLALSLLDLPLLDLLPHGQVLGPRHVLHHLQEHVARLSQVSQET